MILYDLRCNYPTLKLQKAIVGHFNFIGKFGLSYDVY